MQRVVSAGVFGALCASSLFASTATAGLTGQSVQLSHAIDGSLFVPGGATLAGPNVVVGDGIEWSVQQTVYDFDNPFSPINVGFAQYDFDIGDDYIELTIHTHLIPDYWDVYYQIPGLFNGVVIGFNGAAPEISNAAISFDGVLPSGSIGDWNRWAVNFPGVEAWVDSMSMAPNDPARIFSGANSYSINTQGVAWALEDDGEQIMVLRADLTFVPAPGALAVLSLAGLASRRRR